MESPTLVKPSSRDSGVCLAQAFLGIAACLRCFKKDEKLSSEVVAVSAAPNKEEPVAIRSRSSISPHLIAEAYHIEAPVRQTEPDIQNAKQLFQRYSFQEQLGTGAYGKVSVAISKNSSTRYALKSIPLQKFEADCKDELNIAWQLVHPHIALVHEAFQDRKLVYIMMELCSGGTLSQMMKGKAMKALPFPLFTLYARQMISAIAYMHHHRFAHRDIKPSNFMLHDTHVDSSLKLIDMGFACHVEVGVPLTLRIGTVECSAPEVIRGSYDEKCDVWSTGVVLYYCRVGNCPFEDDVAAEVCRKILDHEPVFHAHDWTSENQDGYHIESLIRGMLQKRPHERPSARQVADANAGWLGLPEPDPSFLGVHALTKECSKETLTSGTESRGRTSLSDNDHDCSTGSGSPGGSPGSSGPFAISRLWSQRRKSGTESKPITSQEIQRVNGKRKSRRSSAGTQLLNQVRRIVSNPKLAG